MRVQIVAFQEKVKKVKQQRTQQEETRFLYFLK